MRGDRILLGLLLIAVLLGGGMWLMMRDGSSSSRSADSVRTNKERRAQQTAVAEMPPVAESRFLNTSGEARYVGHAVCADCHAAEYESYLATPHSRALDDVDLEDEPEKIEFEHALSGRRYKVYRKADQMWHQESMVSETGEPIVLADHPIRYTIGSGHHSRSYLVESDGFLLESPITWYASKDVWAVSPGYDAPEHPGFQRVADVGCIHCHAGRVELVKQSRFQLEIHERTIGCESCHGPGSLHVERHTRESAQRQDVDLTIVNPIHLSRERREAACAQCHLRGDATVILRGRSPLDFRPSLRLSDFQVDFVLEHPDKSMKVVGHVEQMRLSQCYQQSDSLTCTTCHDPHFRPTEADRIAHFRQKCLECHSVEACGIEPQQRREMDVQDNCVGCHMPQSSTDIPHFAFTHHRVGLHDSPPVRAESEAGGIGRLIPLQDVAHLPQIEQDRALGLAYLELSDKQRTAAAHEAYRQRSIGLLQSVRQVGMRDAEVDAALARVYWEQGELRQATRFAEQVVDNDAPSRALTNALFVLGDAYLQMRQPAQALPRLEELVQRRRQSEDWVLLAACRQAVGRIPQAIDALQQALQIDPYRIDVHDMLAQLYALQGNREAEAEHRRTVNSLQQQNRQARAPSQR